MPTWFTVVWFIGLAGFLVGVVLFVVMCERDIAIAHRRYLRQRKELS